MKRTRGQPGRPLALTLASAFSAALVLVLGGCPAPHRDTVAEVCNNHLDDDGNGAIDCQDTACMGKLVCTPEICDNNLDDNGDGKFDCADASCIVLPICGGGNKCGNGVIDPGEDCDGLELGGRTCITQGFLSGALACTACAIDTAGCSHDAPENCHNGVDDDHDGKIDCADSDCAAATICLCGDGVLDPIEPCDGPLVQPGDSCEARGYSGGVLTCTSDCLAIDTSTCTPAVCGDGIINTGESCDDGNAVAGDGCDATCQVELGPLCATATPLPVGVSQHEFSHGTNGFDGSCMGSGGEEMIFVYTPAASGTVTIVLNSALGLGLYVRKACADAETELACASPSGSNTSPAINLGVSAGVPLSVFVDESSVSVPPPGGEDGGPASAAVTGPFTLIVVQTP